MDNSRTPAMYAVRDEAGRQVGVIMGTTTVGRERARWEVCWLSPAGVPRTVHHAASLADAKAWATTWDGRAPERWR